ncbi:divalent-cation tolerance protein CutA [Catellatospora tritici]|uniref:divalent-cation tolerance protein CutA n=1 Tax=Catellatospora tritici TaxID=2851566 RepID=UPI001C2CE67E|nr:divalent-cation tolerance protein CutA [Catellatospora tritici]MBV1853669.1 divalent-cation tolerance protein CutA [Catellatospora tritici]
MTAGQVVQVVTTVDSRAAADVLATVTVEARAAACAQVDGPIRSTYRWQGAVESAEEWRITFKTTAAAYPRLEAIIRDNHSYDVPEILCTDVTTGHPAYLAWVAGEVSAG